jgi:hypothetical protein
MSKYITHFQTEAEYQTALPTLDLPNVSLVDELGEVHYHRALYGAHAGDICLYDVAEGQKIFVTKDNWNLTDYPTASYPIIGIVVFDASAAGLTVMSNFGITADGSKTTSNVNLKWQKEQSIDWGLAKYTSAADAKTDFNGKANTTAIINAIKAWDTSHSTDNITGYVGGAIQAFVTEGTNVGDWYVGGVGELYKAYENQTVIKASADKIYNAGSTLGMNGNTLLSNDWFWSSSEGSRFDVWRMGMFDGSVLQYTKNEAQKIRAFLRV